MQRAILRGKQVVLTKSLSEWVDFCCEIQKDSNSFVVAKSWVDNRKISTVFLPLGEVSRSEYFETATFINEELVEVEDRYSTWQDAEVGHYRIAWKYSVFGCWREKLLRSEAKLAMAQAKLPPLLG